MIRGTIDVISYEAGLDIYNEDTMTEYYDNWKNVLAD